MDPLSDGERLILMNQYAILEFLSRAFPEVAQRGHTIYHSPETYAWYQDIVRHGYHTLMPEVSQNLERNELSPEDETEILNILDMYRDIQTSFDQLEDKGDLTEELIAFEGWDGNSSRGEMWFAKAFCYRAADEVVDDEERKADRYGMIKPSPIVNSHFPVTEMYRRMLIAYKPVRAKKLAGRLRPLTVEEIKTVLGARSSGDINVL